MRARVGLLSGQLLLIAAYIWVLNTDAPPPFSVEEWIFLLLPPLVFMGAVVCGVGIDRRPASLGARVLTWSTTTACGAFALGTVLLIPVSVLGNMFFEI